MAGERGRKRGTERLRDLLPGQEPHGTETWNVCGMLGSFGWVASGAWLGRIDNPVYTEFAHLLQDTISTARC